jgi:hypothetical protein
VRANVPWDAGDLGDPQHHPVDVAPVNPFTGGWPKDQRPRSALAAARLEDPEHRHGHGHGGGLAPLADQVQDTVPAQRLGVVLHPDGGGLGGA